MLGLPDGEAGFLPPGFWLPVGAAFFVDFAIFICFNNEKN